MNKAIGLILKIAPALVLTGVISGTAWSATPAISSVVHNVPPLLSQARFIGQHNPAAQLQITVGLKLHNQAQLKQFLHELQDPSSPNYRHFLEPEQFTELYGPTQADVYAVTNFLNSNGIRVTDVSPNRLLIHAEASTSTLENAFHVSIGDYQFAGHNFYAAATNPNIPAQLSSMVQTIIGLDNAVVMTPHLIQQPAQFQPKALGGQPPGLSPQQVATAYDWPTITNTNHGAGVNIGIATAYGFRALDVTRFWNHYGLPLHKVNVIHVDGVTRLINVETSLDIERSGSMAPGATIYVYEGVDPQFSTFTDVYNQFVTDNVVDVVTTSWGAPESETPLATILEDDAIFEQANAQGISLFAAAGDNGSSDGTGNSNTADYPSSDPFVTAAGGTTLYLNSDDTINNETVWGGSGGADSAVFTAPVYQQTALGLLSTDPRVSSDMAMDADPSTGYSVYANGKWAGVYGGTSFVAPQLAGLFAVEVSRTGRIGRANHWIYLDATTNYATDFHDITSGCNGLFCAVPGWDHPTGWGTPDGRNLIENIQTLLSGP
jgi:kumamolisin